MYCYWICIVRNLYFILHDHLMCLGLRSRAACFAEVLGRNTNRPPARRTKTPPASGTIILPFAYDMLTHPVHAGASCTEARGPHA